MAVLTGMRGVKVFDTAWCDLVQQLDLILFIRRQQVLHSELIRVIEAEDFIEGPVFVGTNHLKRLSALPQCDSILWHIPPECQIAEYLI